MKMIRSFLPVGQGAFCCEQIQSASFSNETINIVYDCGSSTDVELVKKQIKATFMEDEPIHAVFISHLHDDHINGLEFLLEYCCVKNIIFPLTTNIEKAILVLNNLINGVNQDSFAVSFIKDPSLALENKAKYNKRLPHLIQISPEDYIANDNGQNTLSTVNSGENLSCYICDDERIFNHWMYIPFNFRYKDRTQQLTEKLQQVLRINDDEILSVENLWIKGTPEIKNKIRAVYKSLPGSLNTNSMTLYSGTSRCSGFQCFLHSYPCFRVCCDCCCKNVGCLYTGDYEAGKTTNFIELKERYIKYWDNIGCIQIPHHGSKKDYNKNFSSLDAYFIIFAGQNNKYNHPHPYVIRDLMFNKHYPLVVTEENKSAIHFVVDY